jgi:hypothetical protein
VEKSLEVTNALAYFEKVYIIGVQKKKKEGESRIFKELFSRAKVIKLFCLFYTF